MRDFGNLLNAKKNESRITLHWLHTENDTFLSRGPKFNIIKYYEPLPIPYQLICTFQHG